jgi:hypothetical protein
MAARDCSFEYFRASYINDNDPVTSQQLGHNNCNWVKTLAAACCKFSGSFNKTKAVSRVGHLRLQQLALELPVHEFA